MVVWSSDGGGVLMVSFGMMISSDVVKVVVVTW
jgi:hypothetical protein